MITLSDMERHGRAEEKKIIRKEWSRFEDGTEWVCIRCMRCCTSNWAINLTWTEHDRFGSDPRAADLNIDKVEVDPETGLSHPYFVIKGACPMLEKRTRSCRLHPDWPYTCATYPFLLMPDGEMYRHRDCPGFGHGGPIRTEEMKEKIKGERCRAGMMM